MIPILYDKTEAIKIGFLTDCIKCEVLEERNGEFELTLVYPSNSELLEGLEKENIIISDANDYLKNQKFRIYNTRKLMSNRIEVRARHISFDLAHDWIDTISIDKQSCEYVLNTIFRNSQYSTHYRGYSDIVMTADYRMNKANCIEAIGGKTGSILDTFGNGAEILRDNTEIHVLNKRGHDNEVSIEYRKNLTGLTAEEDTTDLVTRIRPYATITDSEGNEIETMGNFVDSPLITNYAHPYVKYIDYSSEFDEDNLPTLEKLHTLATKEYTVNKIDIPKLNYKIEFVPLSKCAGYEGLEDRINLCDTVTIRDTRYNIDTQAKVIKVVYNVLRDRYDKMELGEPRTTLGDVIGGSNTAVQGPPGPPGPQGPAGADGSIGDFPNTLPSTPVITSKLYGFASVELSWTFENKVYYSYELYGSKTKGFTPNTFNLIFSGQASTFLHQVKPDETWYYRVCAVNSHGQRTQFSEECEVKTIKIDDLSNYVETAAIGDALIGTLSLDRGWVGQLKGNWIDAKQLSVTDGNGKRTLDIDSFGNVRLDVANLSINSSSVVTNDNLNSALGSYPTKTEMSSAITQTATEISSTVARQEVQNMQIGGRNLIKNTPNILLQMTDYSGNHNSCSLVDGTNSVYVRIAPTVDGNVYDLITICEKLIQGEWYTISFEFWNDSGSPVGFYWYPSEHYSKEDYIPSIANKWQKVSFTYQQTGTTGAGQTYNKLFGFQQLKAGVRYAYTNLQLERGKIATSWSPSPSDYSTTTQMNSAIQQKADSITSTVNANYTTLNNKFNNYPTTTQMNSAIQLKANEITSNVSMTKLAGVELLPQGYRHGDSTSGYSVLSGGTLKCDEWGLYTTERTYVVSDYIAVDPNLPITYEYEITNADGTPYTYLGVEQYTRTTEVIDNSKLIYFLQISFTGTRKDSGTLTLNSNTRYIRFRWMSDWSRDGMSYCQLSSISLKQLGSINQSTQISQMSDTIKTKVDVNGVKSTIQQNPESVRIGFNAISNYFDLNSTRLQVGHSDGSYTQIGQNGIVYYDAYANWKYHSLMKQGWLGDISGTTWSRTITLPASFKGKVFSVIISIEMVNAVNTHDVIKHYKVTVPQATVNYANGTFVINMSALAYYVPGQGSATAITTNVSWIAIA